jgi:SWI/SNF-related matrix-associated actin-dependent regulator of chromatin subfamily A-like protein 1
VPTLHPYQVTGAEWLATKRFAYLADEMRVGKTPQAIRACEIVNAKRILVICPAVARLDWARKFQSFSTVKRQVLPVLSQAQYAGCATVDVCIVSYDLFSNEKMPGSWDVVILDEAHYLKRPEAKRTKAILGRLGVVHKARHVWCLSGTPATNHSGELWPILRVFGIYAGDYETFVREFCTGYYSPYGFQITGSKNVPKLRELLRSFMLRRRLRDVFPEMPPIEFSDYVIAGGNALQEFVGSEFSARLREAETLDDAVRILEANSAHLATLRREIGMLKVAETIALVQHELNTYPAQKVVLFAIHTDVVRALAAGLSTYSPAVLYGATSPGARDAAVRMFTESPECQVFIGNVMAAGVTIDLSVADVALFVEASWVPGDNKQAAMRLVNMNKQRPVDVRFLGLADSVDEDVARVLRRKTRDLTELFDGETVAKS